jgi:hypothetical protein
MQERRDAATYIVSEYEAANIDRTDANAMVLEQFMDAGGGDFVEAAIAPFRQMLDDIDKARQARGTPQRERGGSRQVREKRRNTDRDSGTSTSGSGSEADGTQGEWPWSRREQINDPELAQTIKTRRKFRAKLEKAKDSVVTSVGAPAFPETLWTAILKHGYIDFDKLNGAHFYAVNEEEGEMADIGSNLTIGVKSKNATKPVTTSTDWLYCYGTYEKAVLWAFPHRKDELRKYYDKFHQLFRSYSPSAHIRLINLDRAIRNEVASSATLKLTDETLFSRLREQYLSVDGAGYQASGSPNFRTASRTSSSGNRRPRTKVHEPCRQWNADRCSRPEEACIFLHQCTECKGEHKQIDCPQTKSGGGGRAAATRR